MTAYSGAHRNDNRALGQNALNKLLSADPAGRVLPIEGGSKNNYHWIKSSSV